MRPVSSARLMNCVRPEHASRRAARRRTRASTPDDREVVEPAFRLVMHDEFSALDGLAEGVLFGEAVAGVVAGREVEHLGAVPAELLASVHGGVGPFEELGAGEPGFADRHPDAGRHHNVDVLDHVLAAEHRYEPLADGFGAVGAVAVVAEHGELVAADAGDGVGGS